MSLNVSGSVGALPGHNSRGSDDARTEIPEQDPAMNCRMKVPQKLILRVVVCLSPAENRWF